MAGSFREQYERSCTNSDGCGSLHSGSGAISWGRHCYCIYSNSPDSFVLCDKLWNPRRLYAVKRRRLCFWKQNSPPRLGIDGKYDVLRRPNRASRDSANLCVHVPFADASCGCFSRKLDGSGICQLDRSWSQSSPAWDRCNSSRNYNPNRRFSHLENLELDHVLFRYGWRCHVSRSRWILKPSGFRAGIQ